MKSATTLLLLSATLHFMASSSANGSRNVMTSSTGNSLVRLEKGSVLVGDVNPGDYGGGGGGGADAYGGTGDGGGDNGGYGDEGRYNDHDHDESYGHHDNDDNDDYGGAYQDEHEHSDGSPYGEPGYGTPDIDRLPCHEVTTETEITTADVVLAISDCVDALALETIEAWIVDIEKRDPRVSFSTTMVQGGCQVVSGTSPHGDGASAPSDSYVVGYGHESGIEVLLSQERAAHNMARLEPFKQFGRVLQELDDLTASGDQPTTIVSFVTDHDAFEEIQGFERHVQFEHTFNFQLCPKDEGCSEAYDSFIQIDDIVQLFLYGPFTTERRVDCDGVLDGGLSIAYVDDTNQRQCYCACPAGYSQENGGCKPPMLVAYECEWAKTDGFRKEIRRPQGGVCQFNRSASSGDVPVPFVNDTYTVNSAKKPHIDLIVTKLGDPVYDSDTLTARFMRANKQPPRKASEIPASYGLSPVEPKVTPTVVTNQSIQWKDYQQNGKKYLDQVTFNGFGKYKLEVNAHDCHGDTQCPGCLAVVDLVRPKHTSRCPSILGDDTELTEDNLATAQDRVKQFYSFGDEASNDNCHQSNRCDKQVFKLQNFFEKDGENQQSSNAPTYEDGRTCFDRIEALDAFLQNNKAKENPLVNENGECRHSEDNPVQPGQCKRCCGYQTELRELWTDYKCGYDYDTRMCSGDRDEKCSFKQCLIFNGDSVATASANIKASVVAESEKVLEHIDQKTFQTVTQIHRVVDCTSFDSDTAGACNYEAKVSDLIEANAELKLDMGLYANVDDFVFWRYRVRGKDEKWQLWKNSAVTDEILTFDRAETMITIEAWTQCGKVRTFYFYVHLHLNSEIKVCDHFSQMWYQSTISLLKADDTICAYPGSDFAELTFDYHANIGLQYMRDRLNMNISRVTCTGSLDGRNSTTILDIERENADIVKRFGVELVNRETTEAITLFKVECTFTYVGFENHDDHQTCRRSFNIKDCVGPNYDVSSYHCKYTGCAGKRKTAGLYEACGGKIIRASRKKTFVDLNGKECCQGCEDGPTVECATVLELPDGSEALRRCEPVAETAGVYGEDSKTIAQVPTALKKLLATTRVEEGGTYGASTVLIASVLVVLVALVVIRRRSSRRQVQVEDQAYYPMLN